MTTKRIAVPEEFVLPEEPRSRVETEADLSSRSLRHRDLNRIDGTRQLLLSGFWTLLAGLAAGVLAATVFGGVSRLGARTNAGWLALIVAMMAVPFALLLLLLGGAKWLRNLRLSRLDRAG